MTEAQTRTTEPIPYDYEGGRLLALEAYHHGNGDTGWDKEMHAPDPYDECEIDGHLILTDDEADGRAAEYIRETLWAFNADFLAGYMPVGIGADEVNAIRGDRCEDANE